ncbi:MAG: helix-turn-helix domain-containing protein [Bacteroidales bacterium]|nr:helix-turn-helix domain-containing protein [Bacteroidales bacterium]
MINDINLDSLILKAKLRNEIAEEYGISRRTLSRWFKKARLNIPSGLIDPYHLTIIYRTFGFPTNLKKS